MLQILNIEDMEQPSRMDFFEIRGSTVSGINNCKIIHDLIIIKLEVMAFPLSCFSVCSEESLSASLGGDLPIAGFWLQLT